MKIILQLDTERPNVLRLFADKKLVDFINKIKIDINAIDDHFELNISGSEKLPLTKKQCFVGKWEAKLEGRFQVGVKDKTNEAQTFIKSITKERR